VSWENRIVNDAALAPYFDSEARNLRARVRALIKQQQATWPMLRNAVAALDQAQYKQFIVKGAEVFAQFNPARIVSTAAKVDAASIKARPCFLCAENLPAEEHGVAFGDDYVVLCNPFPVLPDHLVISARTHTPQAIHGNFGALLDLAEGLGEEFFALYNGPACGASAPDHLHFQVCSRERLPITRDVETWERRYILRREECEVFTLPGYRINALIARSRSREALIERFEQALSRLAAVTEATAEPLLNLVVTHDAQGWTVYLYPRSKHRPACYFAEGERKLTISPAGIDLSGVVVVPDPQHFARVTAHDIEAIYAEVMLDGVRLARLIEAFPPA
jgi:DNA-binding Lrp family transcriptional regulator